MEITMKKFLLILTFAVFLGSCGNDYQPDNYFATCEETHRYGNAPMECAFQTIGYVLGCGLFGESCHR